MDLEFDKEMDTLLRQTARSEAVSARRNSDSGAPRADANHLDADALSAFAESALPEKARQRYLRHLADCDKCRKNLSGLIALNAEPSFEIDRAEQKQFVQTPVSWYRKLFAVPRLALTMGALVLVFSGIVAYTVLQNGGSPNAEVSQTYERQTGGRGMSSDGDAAASDSYPSSGAASNVMSSNAASMNSSANSAANFPPMSLAPAASANANVALPRIDANKDMRTAAKPVAPSKEQPIIQAETSDSAVQSLPFRGRTVENQTDDEAPKQQEPMPPSVAQNQAGIAPDSGSVRRVPAPAMRAEDKKKLEASRDGAAEKLNAATSVGGKTFKRANNVWYDSAYRGQATTNVVRGTAEYKKLDAGLRRIAENLGGTSVIVWKNKAYRIE